MIIFLKTHLWIHTNSSYIYSLHLWPCHCIFKFISKLWSIFPIPKVQNQKTMKNLSHLFLSFFSSVIFFLSHCLSLCYPFFFPKSFSPFSIFPRYPSIQSIRFSCHHFTLQPLLVQFPFFLWYICGVAFMVSIFVSWPFVPPRKEQPIGMNCEAKKITQLLCQVFSQSQQRWYSYFSWK